MAAGVVRVPLPGGSWIDGARIRDATVRPMTGADEARLADRAKALSPLQRTSAILSLCVTVEGASGDEILGRLTIGDREALLLHVHRLTFGDALHCVLTCPHDGCGERMDLELSASDLLLPPYENAEEWYDVGSGDEGARLRFRLATGLDQELAVATAPTDPAAAAAALAARCIAADERRPQPADLFDDETVRHLAAAMLDRDPQAEIVLDMTCPACGRSVTSLFDAASFVYEELAASVPRLYREVHTLALRYHWSESEILRLTQPERRRYLDLLAETAWGER